MIWLLLYLLTPTLAQEGEIECPAGCFCDHRKGETLADGKDGVRIRCVQMADDKFDPSNLPSKTLQLDISNYDLQSVPRTFLASVKYLEKADLSQNEIVYIEDDAFAHLAYLRTLDLSHNKIARVSKDTFSGLGKLEKLKLSYNLIKTIQFGAFSDLSGINKIDLAENPLICDCHLAWILDWTDVAGAKARCSTPQTLENLLVKKLSTSDMTCDVPIILPQNSNRMLSMSIVPSTPQIVFSGDSLRLQCFVGLISNDVLIRWFLNDHLITNADASITNLPPSDPQSSNSQQSDLFLANLSLEHNGNWTCSALLDTGAVHNQSLSVAVISHETVLCPSTTTNTSKGQYEWGVTVAGLAATNTCLKSSGQSSTVEYTCDSNGSWGILNDSQCSHTSDVTDKLYRFAYMNNSDFDHNTLVQSAKKLLEFTGQPEKFLDGMDIVYLSTVLENYLPYLSSHHELAALLVDIAANTMRMHTDVIVNGQLFGHAATRLMATISNISRIVPAFQHHRSNLAVEGFKVSPMSFGGITCSWYRETLQGSSRLFYCSENNRTAASMGGYLLGSVQLPSTLYYQLKLLDRDSSTARNIMFSAFSNDTLFPQVTSSRDGYEHAYEVISSCIMGSNVVSMEPFNLSEPVYVILKTTETAEYHSNPVAAWWDSRANSGLGAWQPDYCKMMQARRDSAVFSCSRLGHYALLGNRISRSHIEGQANKRTGTNPIVYAGTTVACACLIGAILIFTHMFSSVNIATRLKHALPNFWLSVTYLLVFHVVGGEIASEEQLCQVTGMLIHYFTLTTMLWLAIASSIIHHKLVNPTDKPIRHANPYVVNPEEEVYVGASNGKEYKKPIVRFYLVGWGVPLIICGITGGASMSQYSSSGWCFLSLAPAAGAILIPMFIILLIHFFFLFSILNFSSQRVVSAGDHILLSGYKQASMTSLSSQASLPVPDLERSHCSHGYALLAISLILICTLVSGFLSTTTPLSSLSSSTQHTIFGTLYSVLASALGITVSTYYCFLRQDIQTCKLKCSSSKQDETSNLVDLTPNNLSPNPRAAKLTNIPDSRSLQSSRQPQGFQLVNLGGSVLGPSSGRLKQCNIERDSEGSSEYHSVNNAAHLRRPVVASAGVSEADMTDILFSSKMKVNNVNIHVSEGPDKVHWMECAGKEDWRAASQQSFFQQRATCTSSPLQLPQPETPVESGHLIGPDSSSCLMEPSWMEDQEQRGLSTSYSSAYGGVIRPGRYRDHLPGSTSLPRRQTRRNKSHERRQAGNRQRMFAYSDVERAEVCSSSKWSELSSSTAYSARSSNSKGRRKKNKPRRKPRKRSEIFPDSSMSKKSGMEHDPIMEVSSKADNEDDDETTELVTKILPTSLVDEDYAPVHDMQVDEGKSDEESSDNTHLVNQLANRELSNKETCV